MTVEFKKQAALAAVELVQSGQIVGLGHGSTVHYALEGLAEKLSSGQLKNVQGVPCSSETERKASKLGIPLVDLNEVAQIDITIDGADEIDPQFNLIKGGGGALLREKMVAEASTREVIVADSSKLSPNLGSQFPLPVEVLPFGWIQQARFIDGLGGRASLRKHDNDEMVLSDQGNYLLDCDFGPIEDLSGLAQQLDARAGIIAHGLFLGLATDVIIAGPDGIEYHRVARE